MKLVSNSYLSGYRYMGTGASLVHSVKLQTNWTPNPPQINVDLNTNIGTQLGTSFLTRGTGFVPGSGYHNLQNFRDI